jgi:SNF2 family DNA or RNA helicase
MNWQNCNNIIFCGLSDSYEQFYQAIRRCWRFGQRKPVNVHIIISEREMNVLENIKRKEQQAEIMSRNMVNLTKEITLSEIRNTTRIIKKYEPEKALMMPEWLKEA